MIVERMLVVKLIRRLICVLKMSWLSMFFFVVVVLS